MRITITVRDDWLLDVYREAGDCGSNDNEHDLLAEVAEEVRRVVLERLAASDAGAAG